MLFQRYGGDQVGVDDLKDHGEDTQGIGFPLLPVFFPIERVSSVSAMRDELFPLT